MLTRAFVLPPQRPTYIALIGATLLTIGALLWSAASGPIMTALQPRAAEQGGLPLAFEANAGQFDPAVRYQAHVLGGTLYFTPDTVVLSLPQRVAPQPHRLSYPAKVRSVAALAV